MADRIDHETPIVRTKYDWDTWLDGSWWRLRQGVDFTCKVISFERTARTIAKSRGMRLQVLSEYLPITSKGDMIIDPDEVARLKREDPDHEGVWTVRFKMVERISR